MSKVKINVIMKTNDELTKQSYDAIYSKNKIIFEEKNYKTIIKYQPFTIIRENEDYIYNLNFISNKTTLNKCLIKKINKTIELEIYTYYLVLEDNLIKLKYKVLTTNQEVEIKINVNN